MLVDTSAFPDGFVWGAATAAYQIEGAATEGGRGPSHWDVFSHTPGATRHGDDGDIACDHYHRFRDDIAMAADLGLSAYRFSFAWPRLQPTGTGALHPSGVAYYRDLIETVLHHGIRPFATLYHWDLPMALADEGGWPAREIAYRFADYAGLVAEYFGDLVGDWITLNEPWCQAFLGYGLGKHAPGLTSMSAALAAAHHQNLAHGLALRAVKAARPGARVGVTHVVNDIRPASDSNDDHAAATRYDAFTHGIFLDPLFGRGYPAEVAEFAATLPDLDVESLVRDGDLAIAAEPGDFLGVNHYHQYVVRHDPHGEMLSATAEYDAAAPRTGFDWGITPTGLSASLRRIRDDYGPIPLYVTENGAAFHDYADPDGAVKDPERVEYIGGYLKAAAEALADGVDLRGYFYWSLLDNFEWAEGYSQRFGLVHVDFATQTRTPKTSAYWYRDVIAQHRAR